MNITNISEMSNIPSEWYYQPTNNKNWKENCYRKVYIADKIMKYKWKIGSRWLNTWLGGFCIWSYTYQKKKKKIAR